MCHHLLSPRHVSYPFLSLSLEPLQSWNHVGMIPISAIISFFFFGIEELSVQLEEPFSILPLANMTAGMGLSANEHALWHFEEPSFDVEEPTIEHTEKKRRKNALASVLDEFRSR